MNILARAMAVAVLLCAQGCATQRLWEDTSTHQRIWIDATKTTEAALKAKGVDYQVYADVRGKGYLIRKSGWDKMKDYHLRMLGTPVTLVVDAASTVAVVGVYMFVTDPVGTCSLIEALCK
jgi:hypothetical protein